MLNSITLFFTGITAIAGVISLIVAYAAYQKAKAANDLSKTANEIALSANALSLSANELSRTANEIASSANDLAQRSYSLNNKPMLLIEELALYPEEVKIYCGSEAFLTDSKPIDKDTHFVKIKDTLSMDSIIYEGNKEYRLINLCNEKTNIEETIFALNVLSIKIKNVGERINKLTILKSFSMLDDKRFDECKKVEVSVFVKNDIIKMDMAYACKHNQSSSLNLGKIAKIAADKNEAIIDLLENPSRASDILAFTESGYLLECRTINSEIYVFSLYIDRDKNNKGRLNNCTIEYGEDLFFQKAQELSAAIVERRVNN